MGHEKTESVLLEASPPHTLPTHTGLLLQESHVSVPVQCWSIAFTPSFFLPPSPLSCSPSQLTLDVPTSSSPSPHPSPSLSPSLFLSSFFLSSFLSFFPSFLPSFLPPSLPSFPLVLPSLPPSLSPPSPLPTHSWRPLQESRTGVAVQHWSITLHPRQFEEEPRGDHNILRAQTLVVDLRNHSDGVIRQPLTIHLQNTVYMRCSDLNPGSTQEVTWIAIRISVFTRTPD